MKIYLIAIGTGLIILAGIAYEIMVWHECLKTESWWYCLRILG